MGLTASKLSKIGGLSGMKRLAAAVGPAPSPAPARKGYVPISVGVNNDESKRFMVRVTALRDADFMELLCRSAEEYGFNNEGILKIPYEAEAFEELMMIKGGSKHKILRVRPT